ncbi:hypothetical protein AL059_22705 [Pseudomonas syringae pv. papulans]|nr:hypothetical protein AL059_22705 [Pseudomonas syringae pv. papulans]
MSLSLEGISRNLKDEGAAVLVVQNSYYKEIHNDVAAIISDMASKRGLKLRRREDFKVGRNIASINPRVATMAKHLAVESVLCFAKI